MQATLRISRPRTFRVGSRSLSTVQQHPTSSLENVLPHDGQVVSKRKIRLESVEQSRTFEPAPSVFIRPWQPITSMAEVFAIVRGIERKFGRVKEFRVVRDYEVTERHQHFFRATFRSRDALELIPHAGEVIQIEAPAADPMREGGVGLDDLEGLLEAQDRLEKVEDAVQEIESILRKKDGEGLGKEMKLLDVRIERAERPAYSAGIPVEIEPSRNKRLATGHAFLDWGGFTSVRPLSSSPYTSQSSDFCSPAGQQNVQEAGILAIDRQKMRTVLTKWSELLNRPDPSVPIPDTVESHPTATSTSPTSLQRPAETDTSTTPGVPSESGRPVPEPSVLPAAEGMWKTDDVFAELAAQRRASTAKVQKKQALPLPKKQVHPSRKLQLLRNVALVNKHAQETSQENLEETEITYKEAEDDDRTEISLAIEAPKPDKTRKKQQQQQQQQHQQQEKKKKKTDPPAEEHKDESTSSESSGIWKYIGGKSWF